MRSTSAGWDITKMTERKLDREATRCRVGVLYLVINVYLRDGEPGADPAVILIRRARATTDAQPAHGRVVSVLEAQGYQAEFRDAGDATTWPYVVKAFMAKRPVQGSPLGRAGTLWTYRARRPV